MYITQTSSDACLPTRVTIWSYELHCIKAHDIFLTASWDCDENYGLTRSLKKSFLSLDAKTTQRKIELKPLPLASSLFQPMKPTSHMTSTTHGLVVSVMMRNQGKYCKSSCERNRDYRPSGLRDTLKKTTPGHGGFLIARTVDKRDMLHTINSKFNEKMWEKWWVS